jgi:uncharacterized protein DUF4405
MKTLRRVTSLVLLIDFILMTTTFVVLYIVPAGRIANWADWRLWGLSKDQWSAIHTNLGTLFLIAIIFHIYVNWKPIIKYLKNKKNELTFINKDSIIAFVIIIFVILGTYFKTPPLSSFLDYSAGIKDKAAIIYGDPPYGHAEFSSLKTFVKKMNIDLEKSLVLLKGENIVVSDIEMTLKDIANLNETTPDKLYEIIRDNYNVDN